MDGVYVRALSHSHSQITHSIPWYCCVSSVSLVSMAYIFDRQPALLDIVMATFEHPTVNNKGLTHSFHSPLNKPSIRKKQKNNYNINHKGQQEQMIHDQHAKQKTTKNIQLCIYIGLSVAPRLSCSFNCRRQSRCGRKFQSDREIKLHMAT